MRAATTDEFLLSVKPARRDMADDVDVARPAETSVLDRHPMRDEEGQIRQEFVEEITRAIHAADTAFLREIVAELHEADLGD
jgi:magnesium transporter